MALPAAPRALDAIPSTAAILLLRLVARFCISDFNPLNKPFASLASVAAEVAAASALPAAARADGSIASLGRLVER